MTGIETSWEQRLLSQVGEAIDNARHGKSDQWIADRTAVLGHPLTRTAISEYRRGVRKTMPISDWLILSAALGVPPVTLLFPGLPDRQVELLPISAGPVALDALQWVTGERATIPEGADILFNVESGDPAGAVQGKRDYLDGDPSIGGPYERYGVDDHGFPNSGPEDRLLYYCRELAGIYAELHRERRLQWAFVVDAPDDVKASYYERANQKLVELNERKSRLEEDIKRLGGTIASEEITQHDQANNGDG